MEDLSLHAAVAQKKSKLIRILVEGGADVNKQSYDGKTPLMIACCFLQNDDEDQQYRIINLLLLYQADPNIQDLSGRTALMYSLRYMLSLRTVRALLKNGADPNICDLAGRATSRYIRRRVHSEYSDLLLPYIDPASVNDLSLTLRIRTDHMAQAEQDTKSIQKTGSIHLENDETCNLGRRHSVQMVVPRMTAMYISEDSSTTSGKHTKRQHSCPSGSTGAHNSDKIASSENRRRHSSVLTPNISINKSEKSETPQMQSDHLQRLTSQTLEHRVTKSHEGSREFRSKSLSNHISLPSENEIRQFSFQEQTMENKGLDHVTGFKRQNGVPSFKLGDLANPTDQDRVLFQISETDRKFLKQGLLRQQPKLPPIK